jgi:hypothetical protein
VILVILLGLLILLFMVFGHPEVLDQAPAARIFAVWFLYPYLLLIGYALGRRARKKPVHYMAQCGYCGESQLIPGNVNPITTEGLVHIAKCDRCADTFEAEAINYGRTIADMFDRAIAALSKGEDDGNTR